MYVTKLVGVMFVLIFVLDLMAAIGVSGTFAALTITGLVVGILVLLLIISRQPQNRYWYHIHNNSDVYKILN